MTFWNARVDELTHHLPTNENAGTRILKVRWGRYEKTLQGAGMPAQAGPEMEKATHIYKQL